MKNEPKGKTSTSGCGVREVTGRSRRGCRAGLGATLLCGLITLAGCADDPVSYICTDEARASVMVIILDSANGTGLAPGATVVLEDRAYRDSIVSGLGNPLPGDSIFYSTSTYERDGTYTVRVRRSGYALWEREGVQVTRDQCHVVTARVRARLQSSS